MLASFNLASSLTMLFIEKKDNFLDFKSMGLTKIEKNPSPRALGGVMIGGQCYRQVLGRI